MDDESSQPTGFPNPAQDHAETSLNLHQYVVRHPQATYFWRTEGHGMLGAGIAPGDLLIVDRAIDPRPDDVVVVVLRGEYLVRRWRREPEGIVLSADHPDYPTLLIHTEEDCQVWGVVIYVLHNPNRRPR